MSKKQRKSHLKVVGKGFSPMPIVEDAWLEENRRASIFSFVIIVVVFIDAALFLFVAGMVLASLW